MTYALLISVRFHDGRYHGAGDWPPSPARLFQALVAAAHPGLDSAREALKWLEQLPAPVIAAPVKYDGQPGFKLFVPNNDLDAPKFGGDIRKIAGVRTATKHILPRLFDPSVPLLYIWRFDANKEGDETHAKRICKVADGLYQLGRGVDMAWATAKVLDEAKEETKAETHLAQYRGVIYRPSGKGQGVKLDCPDDGSLDSLVLRHQAGGQRFRHVQDGRTVRTEFANAPKPRFRSVTYNSPAARLLFDLWRTTDAGSPFAPWPLKKAAALVQKLRDGAVAKLTQHSLTKHSDTGTVSKVLVGRDATEADKALRLRIVPLPSIGFVHANRSIRRVLVEVPPDCPIRTDDVAWAFAGLPIAGVDMETGEVLSSLVELVPADDTSMLMHYGVGDEGISSCLWRSVTPLALPSSRRRIDPARQHEEAKQGAERLKEQQHACHEVAQALRHAGLLYRIVSLRVQREPFEAKGERAEAFADGTRFSKHQLWHVEIEFAEEVGRQANGAMVLGNGRYCGLGLMSPVRQTQGVHAFAISDGLTELAAPLELARALRRAVMARAQDKIGKREQLPVFFTGHEDDGAPARSGAHAHLAFVPDLNRGRLLVIAPHVIEHREPSRDERQNLEMLAQALAGFESLSAGRSGKLSLMPQAVDADTDPLFAAATTWVANTPYAATRYAKRNGADSLQSDVLREVQRRGLPVPQVFVNGHLTLKFAVAVPGPVLLGKNLHYGGGLFVAR